MRKFLPLLLFVIVLTAALGTTAFAQQGEPPQGTCPSGFSPVAFEHHTDHPEHHKGIAQDLNNNGTICMKEVGNGLHVHVDDTVVTP